MQERCRCTDEARFPLLVMPCQTPTISASPRRESREVIPPALGHSPEDEGLRDGDYPQTSTASVYYPVS